MATFSDTACYLRCFREETEKLRVYWIITAVDQVTFTESARSDLSLMEAGCTYLTSCNGNNRRSRFWEIEPRGAVAGVWTICIMLMFADKPGIRKAVNKLNYLAILRPFRTQSDCWQSVIHETAPRASSQTKCWHLKWIFHFKALLRNYQPSVSKQPELIKAKCGAQNKILPGGVWKRCPVVF